MKLTVHRLLEYAEQTPVIPAVKDEAGLHAVGSSESKIVFILYGNILTIGDIVEQIHAMGKKAIVHADLVSGLSSREIAADFIAKNTGADGLISTKPPVIRRAHELGLFTIQRFFLLDSMALSNLRLQVAQTQPDVVEVLPAGISKVIRLLRHEIGENLIAGGLILDKEDVIAALSAGAAAVSTTNPALWNL